MLLVLVLHFIAANDECFRSHVFDHVANVEHPSSGARYAGIRTTSHLGRTDRTRGHNSRASLERPPGRCSAQLTAHTFAEELLDAFGSMIEAN